MTNDFWARAEAIPPSKAKKDGQPKTRPKCKPHSLRCAGHSIRLVIGPRGMSQAVPNWCVQLICDLSTPSFCRLVGVCLEVYTDQWDRITSDIFLRSIVQNGYVLEFAEGNSPLLSGLQETSLIERGTSERRCFEIARKRGDRTCRGRSITRLLVFFFSFPRGMVAIDQS